MQCPYKNQITTIDKNALAEDLEWLERKGLINLKNLYAIHGTRCRYVIADEMTKSKEWVFFNRSPRDSKHKLIKKLYDLGYFKTKEVGCGRCEICRTERSKSWSVKAECEGRCWKNKTFLTLTYNPESLPKDRRLNRKDLQKFWKRLRYHLDKHTKNEPNGKFPGLVRELLPTNILESTFGWNSKRKNKKPIRYINCGEYGPKTKRPHYHAVVFNFKPDDLRRFSKDRRGYWLYTSKKINEIWGKGYVIIGNATTETAAYVARYCTKKFKRTMEEEEKMKQKKQNEFIGASTWGFIGYYWWINHRDEVIRNGGILMRTKKGTHLAPVPKPMCKLWEMEDEDTYTQYKDYKEINAKKNWEMILSRTELSEKEYIKKTWLDRLKRLVNLRRDAN